MSITINLENLNVSGEASVLNKARIRAEDASINLRDLTVSGKAKVLEELDINEFCNKIEDKNACVLMSADEYASIQKVLRQKDKDKFAFLKLLLQHLVSFSEGVAVNVVAACLTK